MAVNAAEYDSYNERGWITVDGTSVSSPLVAGMYALEGNTTKQTGGENLWKLKKKKLKKEIYPVTEGSNGSVRRRVPLHRRNEAVRNLLRTDRLGNAPRSQSPLSERFTSLRRI